LISKPIIPLVVDGNEESALPIRLLGTAWIDAKGERRLQGLLELHSYLLRGTAPQFSIAAEFDSTPAHQFLPTPIAFEWVTIPAGMFMMGSDQARDLHADKSEFPCHGQRLGLFRIARVPVTVKQFAEFVEETNYKTMAENRGFSWGWTGSRFNDIPGADWRQPRGLQSDVDDRMDHPVTCVCWQDALAFCRWAKVRLVTEAEWEYAARGAAAQLYPWGNNLPSPELCNYAATIGDTTPVYAYPAGASPFGVLDMAGNALEWTSSGWRPYPYDATDGRENQIGLFAPSMRTLRGGAYMNEQKTLRCAFRMEYPVLKYSNLLSFRVAAATRREFFDSYGQ
jgi:formylglycine-generating enzyme required for sulfatase activity